MPENTITVTAFQVWMRPLGDHCRVRVSGRSNAEWLLQQLVSLLAIENPDLCQETGQADVFTFAIPCVAANSLRRLQKAIASLPEAQLMMRPE